MFPSVFVLLLRFAEFWGTHLKSKIMLFIKNTLAITGVLSLMLFFGEKLHAQSSPLTEGEKAMNFVVSASLDGTEIELSLEETLKDGPVVLYFFPSAYTQGCDLQAHTFSEHSQDFKKAGASIIGMSADDIDRLNDFSADPDFCAGNFPVATDPNGEIAREFGLAFIPPRAGAKDVRGDEINHGFIPRVTFVIDTNREILAVFSSEKDGLSPDEHVSKSLEVIKNL